MGKSWKEQSRFLLEGLEAADGIATVGAIQVGCLQRIADACEMMARDRERLANDVNFYKRRLEEQQGICLRLRHANAALLGHLRKAKSRKK